MNIPKVKKGDRIQLGAGFLNSLIDMTNNNRNDQPQLLSGNNKGNIIKVQNTTGAFVEANRVLAIKDILMNTSGAVRTDAVDDFRMLNNVVFIGTEVSVTVDEEYRDEGRYCVLRQSLEDDEVGEAWVWGVCPVRLNVSATIDDAEDMLYAEVVDGQYYLEARWHGSAKILWKEDGTGEKWALVRIGNHDHNVPKVPFTIGVDPGVPDPDTADEWHPEVIEETEWDNNDLQPQDQGGASPVDTDGLILNIQFRTEYYADGDQKLYGYYRKCHFDACGRLFKVEAEVRYIIDIPEDC